ncbi:MAG: hypothetical protein PHW31_02725 [Candidatus Pacebacteria bacterium]|nr:hypothetical protein [Candidatus Paceibacterota bacterium]
MDYTFQQKKRKTAYKFFTKGLDAMSLILTTLYENAQLAQEMFLRDCPQYPGFGLVRAMFGCEKPPKFKKATVRSNLQRLQKDGLIQKDPTDKFYCLTEKGKEFVSYIENRFLILKNPWDKKLRVIIFDIPEQKRHWRYYLRKELELMQYKQLQKSVYVGKYPLPQSLIKEIEENDLGKDIHIFTVDKADRQEEILKILET